MITKRVERKLRSTRFVIITLIDNFFYMWITLSLHLDGNDACTEVTGP